MAGERQFGLPWGAEGQRQDDSIRSPCLPNPTVDKDALLTERSLRPAGSQLKAEVWSFLSIDRCVHLWPFSELEVPSRRFAIETHINSLVRIEKMQLDVF